MNYKLIYSLLILLFLDQNLYCQPFSEKRTFTKSVPVNDEMTLELNNKYGGIHISSVRSDTVTIRVEVEATSPNLERINKMVNGITVDITETSYLVRVQTEFAQTINMLIESFKGMIVYFIIHLNA